MSARLRAERICLLGGTGFVGRSLAARLSAEGRSVRVITRRRGGAPHLQVLPSVQVEIADPHDDAALARCFEGIDAVVNLAAVLHASRREPFEKVHVELARKVAGACRAAGVPRLLHMSALGASESGPSDYLRSRGRGESVVRETAADVALTVFRPSVIFGANDRFLNLFVALARLAPVMPLACAGARFQPVWVEDVTRAMVCALDDPRTAGQTLELGGPEVLALREIVAQALAIAGVERPIVALPGPLGWLQARVLEWLPGPLMSRDNLRSMQVDNVCAGPFPESLGFLPSSIATVAPSFLGKAQANARHNEHRLRAGR